MVVRVTAKVRPGPVPQVFDGSTPIVPATDPVETAMLCVPWPAVMVQPAGTDHKYEFPTTFITLYTLPGVFMHGARAPLITEGCAGAEETGMTGSSLAGPVPQAFEGVVEIFPAVVPEVIVIVLVPCPEVISQSAGAAQLKVVPKTGLTP